MARHRDIRNMDYEDEYDGYDDIYGHSVDDDYYISPSNRQFIYNRETSRDARLEPADDIPEVDPIEELSDNDRVRLESCLDEIKNSLGPTKVSRAELINLVLKYNYNVELVINAILEDPKYENKIGEKEKDVTLLNFRKVNDPQIKPCDNNVTNKKEGTHFNIPSFNMNKLSSSPKPFIIPNLTKDAQSPNKFNIPSIFNSESNKHSLGLSNSSPKKFTIPNIFEASSRSTPAPSNFKIPNIFSSKSEGNCNVGVFSNIQKPSENVMQVDVEKFDTLSELVSSHLKNSAPLSEVVVNHSQSNDTEIDKVSLKIHSLKVTPDKIDISKSLLSNDLKNNFDIDLSKALKSTGSLPNITRSKENVFTAEKFDIPFIDIDSDKIFSKNVNTKVIKKATLPCNIDISRSFEISRKYGKKPTKLGRVLGRKYKHVREGVYHIGIHLKSVYPVPKAVKAFRFHTQSPDDFIISHLNR